VQIEFSVGLEQKRDNDDKQLLEIILFIISRRKRKQRAENLRLEYIIYTYILYMCTYTRTKGLETFSIHIFMHDCIVWNFGLPGFFDDFYFHYQFSFFDTIRITIL
jgi:hypothetical protein